MGNGKRKKRDSRVWEKMVHTEVRGPHGHQFIIRMWLSLPRRGEEVLPSHIRDIAGLILARDTHGGKDPSIRKLTSEIQKHFQASAVEVLDYRTRNGEIVYATWP